MLFQKKHVTKEHLLIQNIFFTRTTKKKVYFSMNIRLFIFVLLVLNIAFLCIINYIIITRSSKWHTIWTLNFLLFNNFCLINLSLAVSIKHYLINSTHGNRQQAHKKPWNVFSHFVSSFKNVTSWNHQYVHICLANRLWQEKRTNLFICVSIYVGMD